ncbi:MAG TPA: DUF362 domain-containing protein, partial [Candidatus Sulfotelmatobacter sp.]|nr:DUF362 domain-containing protein [Candidatus Sulfotelmatobacter sp.]
LEAKVKIYQIIKSLVDGVLMASKIVIGNSLSNPFVKDGKMLVSKIQASENPKKDVLRAVEAIGGFKRIIDEGDKVLVKPNFNSADSPPASTEPQFLKAIVKLLFEYGATKVVVGESSWQMLRTRKALGQTGTLAVLGDTEADIAFFDEGNFVDVDVGGEFLKRVYVSGQAFGFDKLVYSCCMKTHFRADFSMSLKLPFGFTKKSDRIGFHLGHLKEKLVDLNLIVYPNLILMDGRTCFITGGPFKGDVRNPNLVLASGDRVALDVESIKVVKSFEGNNLTEDPWSYAQIQHAVRLGLGVKNETEYLVVTD